MATVTFKGNSMNTKGDLPNIGDRSPGFTLVNRELQDVSLEDFMQQKKLLNIFPSLDTDVCANTVRKFYEACANRPDVVLLNISMDLPFASGRFCAAEGIENAVTLSAFRSSFPEDFGVVLVDGPLQGLCSRAVVLLDEENNVIYTEQVPEITQEPDYDKVMEKFI